MSDRTGDEPLEERVKELADFLIAHPGARLIDLGASDTNQSRRRYSLAQQLLGRGRLFEHPTTKALSFYDHLQSKAPANMVLIRFLADLSIAVDGEDLHAKPEDVLNVQESIADKLIKAGKAVKVQDTVPTPEDVPTAAPEASLGSESKEPVSIIPKKLQDPRIRFVRVRKVGEIKPDGQPANGKEAMGNGWNEWENAYPFDSPHLAKHIANGGNYGVLCGHGLIVIDADYQEVAAAVDEGLPKTFTIKSGREGAGGFHYYYWCKDLPDPIRLEVPGAKKGEGGDVQSTGKQVIGPGSTHRTGRKYHVVKDLPIAEITAEQLRVALQDFLPPPEIDTPDDLKRQAPEGGDDLDQLRIEKVVPLDGLTRHGHKYQGPCPWHGSETGSNFTIDLDKNVWHCFRHGTGGGPVAAIAIQEGIIDCGGSVRGGLTGQKFKDTLKIAQEKYGLVRQEKARHVGGATKRPTTDDYPLWSYTIDPDNKIPLSQLFRWPKCFAEIGLRCSVPLRTCEEEVVAAVERAGGTVEQVQKALETSRKIYDKFALGEDQIDKKAIIACGQKVGADFEADQPKGESCGEKGGAGKAADLVMAEIEKSGIEVFTDQFKMPFAAIERDGHREVHPISMDSNLGLWLTYLFYKATGGRAPPREALDQVVRTLMARAQFEGEVHELSLRVAWHEGDLYYDLGREDWKAVRISPSITPHGWEVVDRPPIMFKRNAQTLPQVIPNPGGDWSGLWEVVNLPLDTHGALCRSHVIQMFIPGHPRPFIDFYNRRGGGKTFTAMTLRSLVDPTTTPLAELKDMDRNFNNIMDQNYMPVFDNLKTITDNLEGKFCRCVTGETAQERRLGTNRQQEVYQYQRTGILTSVYQVGLDKPEVAARIIYLMVPFIENPDKESDLNKIFFSVRPRILGFIFTTIAKTIEILPEVKIDRLPRMADYTVWGEAISRALGEDEGVFVKQYEENISQTISETLDANPLGQAILEYFEDGKKEYVGTASPFYDDLRLIAAERNIDIKSREAVENWPGAANALTRKMPNIVDDLKRFKLHYAKTTYGELSNKAKGKMAETKLAPSRSVIMFVKEDSEIFSELPTERCKAETSRYAKNIVRDEPDDIKKGSKNDKTILSGSRREEGS